MMKSTILAIVLVLILGVFVGCSTNYYVMHTGTIKHYCPVDWGDDTVQFDDDSFFACHVISVWNKYTLEYDRDCWLICENTTYSLVHKVDREFILVPPEMAEGLVANESQNCGCK